MSRIDSEKFYNNAIKKYGVSPQGICWNNSARQQLRFRILHSFLPKNLHTFSVVDAGCGFGDFYNFLKNSQNLPQNYIGIDSISQMCLLAKKHTNQEIIKANILFDELPVADYYVCSGAMNILTSFETTLFIQNCFKASKKAFIFNVLYGDCKSETYNYLNKNMIEKIAKELNVKEIVFKDEYIDFDISVGFYK